MALLPGSRAGEISQLLPDMLASAAQLRDKLPQCRFCCHWRPPRPETLVEQLVAQPGAGGHASGADLAKILAAADIALVASGTATLETALMGTPMVILYRVASLTFSVARLLVRVPNIGMANLLAEETLFPELIQDEVTPTP